jgi:hypothetical protein
LVEAASEVARVLHADLLLAATFLPLPGRCVTTHDEVADIVDVDHRA